MTEVNYSWVDTQSGRQVDLRDPSADDIHIEDIAHALARVCRFGGNSKDFYSVAQHSVLVSLILSETPYAFEGLMHDAAEAYIGDLVSPLKSLLPEYLKIEQRLERAIAEKFYLEHSSFTWPNAVKDADWTALFAEKKSLLPNSRPWSKPDNFVELRDTEIHALPPEAAETLFLKRFKELNVFDRGKKRREN